MDMDNIIETVYREIYAYNKRPDDPEWDTLVTGSASQQWRAIGYMNLARSIFSTVAEPIWDEAYQIGAMDTLASPRDAHENPYRSED